ncbi:MAG: amidohydrolase, partial [Deltaproteobacteria bacterium]|nr:amidohydrolase [Deltaproteobacteria bacterium]
DRRDQLAGEVVFMFQPGEEGFAGARSMIEEGVLEGCEAAFALHITPIMPSGVMGTRAGALMASADFFHVAVKGRGGHASMPHDCVDPVPVACEIVQAMQSFITRRIPATDPAVLTVTQIHGGTTGNVIPEEVTLQGTLRALSEKSRELAQGGIRQVAEHVARAHGTEAQVEIMVGYPVTTNDSRAARLMLDVAREVTGGSAIEMPQPVMGAEDFSYVLNEIPGAMGFLGVRPKGEGPAAPCHSNRMLLDEDGMVYGTAFHAAMAMRMLETGLPG